MPQAARHYDLCNGHYCYPPRPNAQASTNVFVNSRGSHRMTDIWGLHACSNPLYGHSAVTVTGSSTVFVNGLPKARVRDLVVGEECYTSIMTGSNDVFVGG